MTNRIFTRLDPAEHPGSDQQRVYSLKAIRAIPGVVVTEPHPECYLAVHVEDACLVSFAAFDWNTEYGGDVLVDLMFKGEGTGGNLREMRHTYWGPEGDGYVFYLPLNKTIAVLEALKQYFDAG